MKNQVTSYVLIRYQFPKTIAIKARREVPYEFKLASRLLLDEMVFNFNKGLLEERINEAIDKQDIEQFKKLSKQYAKYVK
ncbi:IDEAL domain-containing protein [Alkalibacillus silvisoli]|uniref:IDEAL domain-containing protein n=1 Tax=Alkalibacillus silvisoli TaxID=392823 RepID=A0ABP3K415_9BACI